MDEEKQQVINEALDYFRQSPALERLLDLFREKYYSLGRIGGRVRLESLKDEDRESLGGLLGREIGQENEVSVSAKEMEKALNQTRFASISLQDLVFAFAGGSVLSSREEKERYEAEKELFFAELARGCDFTAGRKWLEHIRQKGAGSRSIHQAYDKDRDNLRRQLLQVLQALQEVPCAYERLPVFAARITGDPHGFDLDTERGKLLLAALQFLAWGRAEKAEKAYAGDLSYAEKGELLADFGIIRDDILNFVPCTGLLAYEKERKTPLLTWEHACAEHLVFNVPLRELTRLSAVEPFLQAAMPRGGKVVFVVENAGVFSAILDRFVGRPHPPLVCTHGRFNLASLMLLDLLAQGGCRIFYSGDYDPEGLQMAQQLLQRFDGSVLPWRYTPGDYRKSLPRKPLKPAALQKLNSIAEASLLPVKEAILAEGQAGYQEHIISTLVEDIEGSIDWAWSRRV